MFNHRINRIVIIGNGFDLAHGLPTKYEDFINWYWGRCLSELRTCHNAMMSDVLCQFTLKDSEDTWYSYLWANLNPMKIPTGKEFYNWVKNNPEIVEFNSCHLLNQITQSIEEKKWVDIEEEYYKLLKLSLDKSNPFLIHPKNLNVQFKALQDLLVEYLRTIKCDSIVPNIKLNELIYEPIDRKDISVSRLEYFDNYCLTIANSEDYSIRSIIDNYEICDPFVLEDFIHFQEDNRKEGVGGSLAIDTIKDFPISLIRPSDVLLVSFNYTALVEKYSKRKIGKSIHIHGKLSDAKGVIFGYGDEMDEVYKNLLNNANNEYLTNVKTIRYLETDNYDKLLKFINSAPYQVYIMGHSCGNSDRTLLNTLFEHNNCVSIKPFYYQKENGNDNYIEIVQNIHRNFTDMKLMRERVVNKTYCEPLPQCCSYVEEVE